MTKLREEAISYEYTRTYIMRVYIFGSYARTMLARVRALRPNI